MPWLWYRPVATAPIQPLTREPPYAASEVLTRPKKKKKKKKKKRKKKKKKKKKKKEKKKHVQNTFLQPSVSMVHRSWRVDTGER